MNSMTRTRGDKLFPVVGTGRHNSRDLLGADDGDGIGSRCAVYGRYADAAPGFSERGQGLDKTLGLLHVLYDLQ